MQDWGRTIFLGGGWTISKKNSCTAKPAETKLGHMSDGEKFKQVPGPV